MQNLEEFYYYEFNQKTNYLNSSFASESFDLEIKHKRHGSYFTNWVKDID